MYCLSSIVLPLEVIVFVPEVAAKVVDDAPASNDIPVESVRFPYTLLVLKAHVPANPVKSKFLA